MEWLTGSMAVISVTLCFGKEINFSSIELSNGSLPPCYAANVHYVPHHRIEMATTLVKSLYVSDRPSRDHFVAMLSSYVF